MKASGDVKFLNNENNFQIYTENATYEKNNEIIKTINNSKAIYQDDKILTAKIFNHDIKNNILKASGDVRAENKVKKTVLKAEKISYFKNENKITTNGKTFYDFQSKYKGETENLVYLIKKNYLSSDYKTKIINQNKDIYYLNKFLFMMDDETVKGEDVLIISNFNLPKENKIYFTNAIIDLKEKSFIGKDIELNVYKSVFDNSENDPRLKGVSAKVKDEITLINKGVFTSCKKTDDCPPWSIKADKIIHDKKKKILQYENAVLNFYKVPVFYFPKFFHPDPSVERQSGFLKPMLNNSNILGSSFSLPYFKALSDTKDITIVPTIFDKNMFMTQIEYREVGKNYNLIADFGNVINYESSTEKDKKNLSHFFGKYDLNLNLKNYESSSINISTERVTNDSYIKLFSPIFVDNTLKPDSDTLENQIKLNLIHENYVVESGIETYETLNSNTSDKYQYILPYYNFDWFVDQNYFDGNFKISSNGANNLKETNRLETSVINNINYNSNNSYWNNGVKTNFSINLKNVNSVGKNSTQYESSPRTELISLLNTELSLPLIKKYEDYTSLLTPKISFRLNPTNMKNYSSSDNKINIGNLFSDTRLGLSDTYEAGRSMTIGLDFKKSKKNLNEINDYFEMKLGTVIRDKIENSIPTTSTLNQKHSNLFGSIRSNLYDKIELGYNFSIDNDYRTFEYNDINATFSLNNIVTKFNFIEENNEMGDANILSNSIAYKFDDKNLLTFKTRRNRKINLTEYYDLVYEYKYDCITAGIKYNKTYYSDSDIKPSENLFFTITFVPITSYEYKDDSLLLN